MAAIRKHAVRHLTAQALATTWAILPERLASFCEILSLRRNGLAFDEQEIESRLEGRREEPVPAEQLLAVYPVAAPVPGRAPRPGTSSTPPQNTAAPTTSTGQSVAVLTIQGTLVPRRIDAANASGGGFVSAEGVAQAFRQAAANPDVGTIVLDINSPGGAVAGIPELAATIREAVANGTRVIAVANHVMASAAFWIGAQASEVVASPSADVGSVGVLAIHQETSQADTQAGITTTVFRSVAHKAELNSVEPLTAEARARVEQRIAAVHEQFLADLATGRNVSVLTVASAFGSGRVFSAAEALAAGMIDRVATLEQVLAELLGGTGTPAGVTPTTAGATARPTLPPVLENQSMDPQLLTALIRCGAITAVATAEQAESARQTLLTMAGCDLAASVAEQVAALARLSASLSQTSTTPAAAALPQPAVPPPVPAAAVSGTLAVADAIAMVRVSALDAAAQLELIAGLSSTAEPLTPQLVLGRIQQQTAATQPAAGVRVGVVEAEADKFAVAARDALLQRAWQGNTPAQLWSNAAQDFVAWQAPRRPNHHLASLPNMARQSLIVGGFDARQINSLANSEVARLVMGADPMDFGLLRAEGAAYNGRAQFANLLYDAANVILRRSYAEATATFTAWARQGESFTDFKTRHKVIAGELSDPQVIPENGTFEETTMLDGREPYSVVTWGERFSITWQTIVDDRLGALTDIPAKQGAAMRRKQNRIVYGVLKDNAALVNDGIALFQQATHKNLTPATGTAISVASLNVAYKLMSEQTGLNSGVFVAVEPRYLIIPPSLRGTALELLGSFANPASSNSNVRNIWENNLQPVIDVELSTAGGGSDTAWYLAADSTTVDTVEYAYLQGLETPAFERQVMFDRLAVAYRMYQSFGAKAIDYRGLYKNVGP